MNDEIKISHEVPPIYEKCAEKFGVSWNDGIVITYGDTVYSKDELSADLIVHESIHVKQQKEIGVDVWWDKYLTDQEFRLAEEVECYRAQIRFLKANIKDRNQLFRVCNEIWKNMVTLYGRMVSYEDAKRLTNN